MYNDIAYPQSGFGGNAQPSWGVPGVPGAMAGGANPNAAGGAQPGAKNQPPPGGWGNTPPYSVAPQGFGTLGYVNPAYANPNQTNAYMQQYEQLVAQGLAPQFAEQQQQLQDSSAARGISSSGAAGYLQSDLLGQQAAAYAQGISPIVQQGYGYTQQDILANQGAANQASYYNAGTYNNYLNSLESAYLNSFGPNTGVTNAFGAGVAGIGNAVGSTYEGALGAEGSALGGIGQGLGSYYGAQAGA